MHISVLSFWATTDPATVSLGIGPVCACVGTSVRRSSKIYDRFRGVSFIVVLKMRRRTAKFAIERV